jgi:hypothetical protein
MNERFKFKKINFVQNVAKVVKFYKYWKYINVCFRSTLTITFDKHWQFTKFWLNLTFNRCKTVKMVFLNLY